MISGSSSTLGFVTRSTRCCGVGWRRSAPTAGTRPTHCRLGLGLGLGLGLALALGLGLGLGSEHRFELGVHSCVVIESPWNHTVLLGSSLS